LNLLNEPKSDMTRTKIKAASTVVFRFKQGVGKSNYLAKIKIFVEIKKLA
jgi:hypothetical protein